MFPSNTTLCSRVWTSKARTTHRYTSSSSNSSALASGKSIPWSSYDAVSEIQGAACGLQRLPTSSILRSLLLGYFFSTPTLFKPGFAFLQGIANSRSSVLNPDVNVVLRAVLKPLLYDHFCAGNSRLQVYCTKQTIKDIGYSGIILCYGKELKISHHWKLGSKQNGFAQKDAEITQWKDGNLETLDMIESGDWLAIKCTGAGPAVITAMKQGKQLPAAFTAALDTICLKAAKQGCKLWIDAEHQVTQPAIDRLTIDLMRRYNKHSKALVYNTIQAYLKCSRQKVQEQLALAHREGWALGIKLVRGAYIGTDPRHQIHDTKQDTDESYDSIVRDLLSGTNLGIEEADFPQNVQLFLAGHNPESVAAAWDLIQTLGPQGKLKVMPDFGQLQGMGDVLGCKFLQQRKKLAVGGRGSPTMVPKMYKFLTWGSVQECMQYLFRRAVENSGGTDRMQDGLVAYKGELKRRVWKAVTWS